MHESNYQLLYYAFHDFFSSQGQTLLFHHFLELFYRKFVKSYIDSIISTELNRSGNFLIACLHMHLVLR